MERSEPTFIPEWLKNGASPTGCSTTVHSDDNAGSKLARNRSSLNSNGHDLGRSHSYERTTSSYFRRSSNGSTHLRSYNSFNRNNRDRDRDRDWEKDTYDSRDKDKSVFGDRRHQNFSDPLGKILPSSFERDGFRRSQSMISGKRGENLPKKISIDSGNANGNYRNGLATKSSPIGSVSKASFERDFPSLGAEERSGAPDIGRVPSPGLSTAIQNLPVSSSAVIGGEKWTSALAEVPVLASNGTGVSSAQQAPPSSGIAPLNTTTGLNMAEAVAQGPPRTQATTQLSAGNQRLEELVIKQSKQLIPVTPSLPKALVSNSADKLKVKIGHQQHPSVTNSSRGAAVKADVSKVQSVGKLQVLKSVRERNGVSPAVKENLSPRDGSKAANSSLSVAPSLSASAAAKPLPNNSVPPNVEVKPILEKRPTSQAQSRNDFFKLMRKKSMANSAPVSSSASEKRGEEAQVSPPVITQAGDEQSQFSLSGTQFPEGGDLSCNGDVTERQNCLCNGKKYLSSDPLFSEEEEAAFLRSMGWEENAEEEGGLTEEEISAFYRDVQKYISSNPSLKILPRVERKMFLFNSQIGRNGFVSSGFSSSDAKLES